MLFQKINIFSAHQLRKDYKEKFTNKKKTLDEWLS